MTLADALSLFDEHRSEVLELCDRYGYGFVVDEGLKGWRSRQRLKGFPHTARMLGPAESSTVPCICSADVDCQWCCGCGWVTRKVSDIQQVLE